MDTDWAGHYKGRIRNVEGTDGPMAAFIGPAAGGRISRGSSSSSSSSSSGAESEVHASTLAILPGGTLLCAFFQVGQACHWFYST